MPRKNKRPGRPEHLDPVPDRVTRTRAYAAVYGDGAMEALRDEMASQPPGPPEGRWVRLIPGVWILHPKRNDGT